MRDGAEANLYKLLFDGEQYVVRALTMTAAIRAWAKAQVAQFGDDSGWTLDDEPQVIELITDNQVIDGVAP